MMYDTRQPLGRYHRQQTTFGPFAFVGMGDAAREGGLVLCEPAQTGGEVGLCPDCQADGWQLPEGATLPFRRGAG